MRDLPSPDRLKYWLDYDENTGVFTWRHSPTNGIRRGDIAGGARKTGYRLIGVRGYGQLMAHRLAWVYLHGPIPAGMEVDHINGDPSDNRIVNLRLATSSQQKMNKAVQSNNRAGLKGAFYHACRRGKKWRSQIKHGSTLVFLGYFSTPEEAHAAYSAASRELFGEFHSDRMARDAQ